MLTILLVWVFVCVCDRGGDQTLRFLGSILIKFCTQAVGRKITDIWLKSLIIEIDFQNGSRMKDLNNNIVYFERVISFENLANQTEAGKATKF